MNNTTGSTLQLNQNNPNDHGHKIKMLSGRRWTGFTYALGLSATPSEVLLAGPGGGAQDVVVLSALEGNLVANLTK